MLLTEDDFDAAEGGAGTEDAQTPEAETETEEKSKG
jgi:hypothetical protein